MTNDEILTCYTSRIYILNHDGQFTEALSLVELAKNVFGIGFCQVWEGLQRSTVFEFILNAAVVSLNCMAIKKVEQFLGCFDKYAHGSSINYEFILKRYMVEMELYFRTGRYEKGLQSSYQAEKYAMTHEHKYHIFLQRGILEQELLNRYEFAISSLSDALYEAEQCENESYIAQVYERMAPMYGMRYPFLGIYFIRKVEAIYKRLNDITSLQGNMVYRANAYYVAYKTNEQANKDLLKEAKLLLDAIDSNKFPLEQNRMNYLYVKGLVYQDIIPLKEACGYYQQIEAWGSVCKCCDAILEIGSETSAEWNELQHYLQTYREAAIHMRRPDLEMIQNHLDKWEEQVNECILGK